MRVTSPANTSRSFASSTSSGSTGAISRPSRTISVRNRWPRWRSPLSCTLRPTRRAPGCTRASTKCSAAAGASTARAGSSRGCSHTIVATETASSTSPTGNRSNIAGGAMPRSIMKLATSRLVEVPISVSVPPIVAA